jgi:dTDP-4-dehydrorhamnose reductase
VEELILVLGSRGQLALSFKKICPKNTIFLSSEDLDLTNTDKIFDALSKIAPKYIFNFAAYNKVDNAETDNKNFLINSSAVKSIAEYCYKRTST